MSEAPHIPFVFPPIFFEVTLAMGSRCRPSDVDAMETNARRWPGPKQFVVFCDDDDDDNAAAEDGNDGDRKWAALASRARSWPNADVARFVGSSSLATGRRRRDSSGGDGGDGAREGGGSTG